MFSIHVKCMSVSEKTMQNSPEDRFFNWFHTLCMYIIKNIYVKVKYKAFCQNLYGQNYITKNSTFVHFFKNSLMVKINQNDY